MKMGPFVGRFKQYWHFKPTSERDTAFTELISHLPVCSVLDLLTEYDTRMNVVL